MSVTSAGDIDGKVIAETQAARWSVALVSLLLFGFLMFRLLPQPSEPIYANFAPSELKPEKIFKVHPIKVKPDKPGKPDKPEKPDKPAKPPKEPKPRIRSLQSQYQEFSVDHWVDRL